MNRLIIFLGMYVLMSCTTSYNSYYQIYKTTPLEASNLEDGSLKFEDENVRVQYHFWGEGGDVGFIFHNKTDEPVYINMGRVSL